MKILLPIDGSTYTHRMLAYLGAHDELLGPKHAYTVLTVVPPIPDYAARFVSQSMIDVYAKDKGKQISAPVRTFAEQHGWNTEFVSIAGFAGDEIARIADAGRFDLVVMGSHGHSALGGVIMGSVATRVLAQCKVPVLLIR